jgi:cell fate regulator YaaT (PSP1 superfamily)
MEEENREIYLAFGVLKPDRPDRILKLTKPVSRGSFVLVEFPEGRKEVFIIKDYCYRFPFDLKDLPVVLRKANPKEISAFEKRRELEAKGKELCETFAKELALEMNLVDVECYFDKSKIIFYYTAEGRIDFRELVKQLARALRMRIEMRQIGVRNETALIGGLGICGKEFCCAQFLKNFASLSIKMAKDQGLILDPNKISGPCGRLLCCLSYEEALYQEFLSDLPRAGSKISLSGRNFRVIKYNFFQATATLESEEGGFYTVPITELKNYIIMEPDDSEEGVKEWQG